MRQFKQPRLPHLLEDGLFEEGISTSAGEQLHSRLAELGVPDYVPPLYKFGVTHYWPLRDREKSRLIGRDHRTRGNILMSGPHVRSSILHMLSRVLELRGVSAAPVFERAGMISPDRDPNRIVPRAQICAALDQSAHVLGDAALGLSLGAEADPRHLGLMGLAFFDGTTLGDCLQGLARFMPSFQSGVGFELGFDRHIALWVHQMVGDCETVRILCEGATAFMVGAMRHIVGPNWRPAFIEFAHRARTSPEIYESFFQAPVRFCSLRGNVIGFDARSLASVNQAKWAHRPNLLAAIQTDTLDSRRNEIVDFQMSDAQLLESVRFIIDGMITLGRVSLVRAAHTLGCPPRTLQRRIARCGTSFEEVTDEQRRSRAAVLMSDPNLAVGEIALAVGYSDAAHFIRAFHRWNGKTPNAYRSAPFRTGGPQSKPH
jgi:AraC-like DNA-binding protein